MPGALGMVTDGGIGTYPEQTMREFVDLTMSLVEFFKDGFIVGEFRDATGWAFSGASWSLSGASGHDFLSSAFRTESRWLENASRMRPESMP